MEKKTKILFVITKSNFGGAQKYVYDLATNLPKDKFEVAVVVGGSGSLIQKLQGQNIRVIALSCLMRDVSAGGDISAFIQLLDIFRNEKPDVVHLNSAKAGGVGALAARIAGVPNIIFTAHGWAFNEERPLVERSAIKFFSYLTVLLSDKTIAVSESVHQDTKYWVGTANRVVTIHNGITAPLFAQKDEAFRELLGNTVFPAGAFMVGTITELHKNKGLEYAISAMSEIVQQNSNAYFAILGDGDEKENLQNLINSLGLQKNIFLLGYVHNAARFLAAFDVFVLPSIKEGLPYVLLEAGLAGIPVVATKTGGIPEIIENEVTGLLVPTRDPGAITKALQTLHTNSDLCSKLGMSLNKNISEKFSLETMIYATEMLYKAE